MSDPSAIAGFLLIGAGLALIGMLIVGIARLAAHRLAPSIVVEYLPPRGGSIVEHGLAVRADRRVLTAAIIDLTVRGKARLLTVRGGRRPVAFQVAPGAQLTAEEHDLIRALQPEQLRGRRERRYLRALRAVGIVVGSAEEAPGVIFFRGRGAFRWHRSRNLPKFLDRARSRLAADGWTRPRANSVHLVLLSLLFLAALVTGLVLILGAIMNDEWIGAVVVLVDIAVLFGVLMLAPPPLLRFTDQGVELRRQLSGLRAYIGMAEQDRLRMLQSPQGALRTSAGGLTPGGVALGLQSRPTAGDPVAQSALDRYVLTERLLPYAILFGQEGTWAREFEHLGGAADTAHNLRSLGSTLQGVIAVLQALVIIVQVLRVIGAVASLFGRD
ncbi:DUF2207 family protein [Microlunatus soli]|uniref:Predicted membrane protein n=1 Tax=Microlunatus soli TaxID=630515 RepID=A0A1H1V444_9ACTN|nr:DUF2207 domain-containing protein [Microlunatus soli]SDS79156.1 Predicted membrane protein [Microlunatus soli]